MARPYSVDLRTRIVRAVEAGLSRRAAAAKFEVSVSFVVKLMQRWRARSFFSRQPAGLEEPADRRRADRDAIGRQPAPQFGDGAVRGGRQQRVDPFGVVGELQLDNAARADVELRGGRSSRGASLDRAHHPFAQIHRIRSRHPSLASSLQQPV